MYMRGNYDLMQQSLHPSKTREEEPNTCMYSSKLEDHNLDWSNEFNKVAADLITVSS